MVEIQDQHASDFIVKLSDFYRFTLEKRKMDIIPLAEELTILDAYMFLLKARFENGIQLSIDINPQHYKSYIPPFTLQLLMENCVKHNVISLERPLQIRLYSTADNIVMENRLQLKHIPEISTRTGLENINQRYLHLLNKEIVIEKEDAFFSIKLPLIYANTDH
jgi:LytS/YehU family sensor histidine kinase